MNIKNMRWHLPSFDWHAVAGLVKELSISPITAKVLLNRGIHTAEEGRVFFHGSLSDLSSPWELPGMEAAVRRIVRGIKEKEKIMVFGDYDVDGITATAVVVSFLRNLGVPVGYYIPERSLGYGLSAEALQDIHRQGYSLVITVDCGISAAAEIAYGQQLGLDFVVTDHHEPGEALPQVEGVVNPKLNGSRAPHSELAGVGVAFKLLQALAERLGLDQAGVFAYLDLVTLGTIADVVPLLGENRILVKNGLSRLQRSGRVGVRALLEVAGVGDGELTPNQVAYALAPRLNAAGRMASPLLALEILLTQSAQRARELALKLQELNAARQLLVQQVTQEALAMMEQEEAAHGQSPVAVLASPFWHPGVTGIVAAKLADMLYKPVILLTVEGELAKGSGRSVPGFDLFQGIQHCRELLLKAGGHAQAVGLTVATAQLPHFREKINRYAAERLAAAGADPTLPIEAEVLPGQLDFQLLDELAQLQPFGYGNPEPVLAWRSALIKDCRPVGKEGEHLKLQILAERDVMDGIAFNMAPVFNTLDLTRPVDLAFRLRRNQWNGQAKLQLVLEDMKPSQEARSSIKVASPTVQTAPVTIKSSVHRCGYGGDLFQGLVQFCLEAVREKAPVYVIFPTQRVLALYERLLNDVLAPYRVTCRRCHHRETTPVPAGVALAAKPLWRPRTGARVVEVAFPGWEKGNGEADMVFGFQNMDFPESAFVRQPVPARDKVAFLRDLAKAATGPLFIYTTRLQQMVHLYQQLRLLLPGKKHRVWYYHQNLSSTQKEMVLRAVAHGLAEIVVANELVEFLVPEPDGAAWRVILDAPYSIEEFYLKGRLAGPGMRVYGIWDEEELYRNELALAAIFPEGPYLEELLLTLKELGPGLDDEPGAVVQGVQRKLPGTQTAAVQYGLEILQETGGGPGNTLNYQNTVVYRAAQEEKRALNRLRALEETGSHRSYLSQGAP
ncbi:MAG TPA: single-stranded-DNA-specific exonuclease RecJ [Clostridia bacterium]|nr:single-stranded-DNA-specific exonuclease RecJ [Clostridia bacterium]